MADDFWSAHTIVKRWIKTLLKALITVGLLCVLLVKVDFEKSVDLLISAVPFAVVAVLLVLILQIGLTVIRWHLIMVRRKMPIMLSHSARYFWVGLFFNQLLPSSIGGDAVRSYCLVRDGETLGRAAVSVLLDRVLGTIGLLILVGLFMPYAMAVIENKEMQWGLMLTLLVAIGGLATLLFADIFARKFPGWPAMRVLTTLAKDGRQLLFVPWGWKLILMSVLIHCISILAVGLCAWALDIRVNWLSLAIIVPVATLLVTLPVSIAGWGVREGVMVVGLGYAGVGLEQALALSVLYGLSLLAVSIPGGFFWLADPLIRTIKVTQVPMKENR